MKAKQPSPPTRHSQPASHDAQRQGGTTPSTLASAPRVVAQRVAMDAMFGDARANRTGLPDHVKSGVESLSGLSLDHVRVHYNSSQPAAINARAYTQAADIHVGPGQERHVPHEAWHVVQQAQGRVRPTMQLQDGPLINDDRGLEHEADAMGTRASSSARTTGIDRS
jgi:hypothetical protein